MSGTRLTRKVTVEGVAVPSAGSGSNSASGTRRLSVFERLGPGAVDVSLDCFLFNDAIKNIVPLYGAYVSVYKRSWLYKLLFMLVYARSRSVVDDS